MKKNKQLLFVSSLFLLALAATQNSHAQIILGHITGTVTDQLTGSPIAGTIVTASIGSTAKGTATTNSSGYYDISGFNGNFSGIIYNLTAEKTGYYSSTVSVTMVSSIDFVISVTQNFTLTPTTTQTPTATPTIPEISIAYPVTTLVVVSVSIFVALKRPKPFLNIVVSKLLRSVRIQGFPFTTEIGNYGCRCYECDQNRWLS